MSCKVPRLTVICHFRNEEVLLPFWLRHHALLFDHGILIDYGSVIVHVMAPPERDFYQLERLWADAPLLLRLQ